MITLKFNPKSIENIVKDIENTVVLVKYQAAEDILDDVTRYDPNPHWSNTFYQSWQITEGNESGYRLKHPTNKRGVPNVKHDPSRSNKYPNVNYETPYLPLHVINTANHASQVENVGTPLHPEPWKIAAHAVADFAAKSKAF